MFVNGRKISVPCYIYYMHLFTFLAARPLFSPLTAGNRKSMMYAQILVSLTAWYKKICDQEPKKKNYDASSVIFTAYAARAVCATVAKVS